MQWLVTIVVVLAALGLVLLKLYRFARALACIDSQDQDKPSCGGCPGQRAGSSDLGITIKPLAGGETSVRFGDKRQELQ